MHVAEKFERGDVMSTACPSREVLSHIASRWGVLVLIALEPGTHRFSELKRKIGGVSERMLAQTLQQLQGDGLIHRVAYAVVPPHVEYTLTPLGQEAAAHIRGLSDWIADSLPRIRSAQEQYAQAPGKLTANAPA